jgi:hypothetical protein
MSGLNVGRSGRENVLPPGHAGLPRAGLIQHLPCGSTIKREREVRNVHTLLSTSGCTNRRPLTRLALIKLAW